MEIKVGSYFYNPAKESHDEFHITLTDKDGEEIFKDKWEGLSFTQRYNKLRGMGDLLSINWAVSRGHRPEQTAMEDIQRIIKEDLS
jgi:hypothetical protein